MKWRWPVGLGLCAFFITLMLHAPAAVMYGWSGGTADGSSPLRIYGMEGTVSQGRFAALTLNQRPLLGETHWHLKPAWLLLLRATADVETRGDTALHVRVSRAVFGKWQLSDLEGSTPAAALLGFVGLPGWPLTGQAQLALPALQFDGNTPSTATGTIEVQNLAWTQTRELLMLGDFTATFSTDDRGILATLASGPGALELSGEARLDREQNYDLHLQLRPRPEATPPLRTLVQSLGQPDLQGWYHLRRQGRPSR